MLCSFFRNVSVSIRGTFHRTALLQLLMYCGATFQYLLMTSLDGIIPGQLDGMKSSTIWLSVRYASR